jgi:hypothetical protein
LNGFIGGSDRKEDQIRAVGFEALENRGLAPV